MTLQKCKIGSVKAWITLCVSLFGLVVAGGAYAQCTATITIPDGANTEIARFVFKSPEGYIVRNSEGYNLANTGDRQNFEDDLNDANISVPGIDTGLNGTATVTYDSTGTDWIVTIEGADALLEFTLSYWNGTTQTCPGGVQGYCGSSSQVSSTHSAECAASYFVSDTCTNSEYCGAADVGTGYCYEGVCEQLLDCSDAQYTARTCTSNDECGDGGGCNGGVCECMTPGPGVCYPGVLDPICFDDDDCGGTLFGTCELGYRYQCVCADGPVCGNGAVEGVEECDDGNSFLGDGCDDACAFERPSCEILLPAASVASGSSISIQILSQAWVTNNTARLHTGYATYHSVSMTNGIGTRNNVLYRTAGNYVITGIVYNPLDISNNTFAECTADLAVTTDGDCGTFFNREINEGTFDEPVYNDIDFTGTFCDVGIFDEISYTYTAGEGWTWDCEGEGGGAIVSCSADEIPVCGPANGGQYDALTGGSTELCTNAERASGFVGVVPPDGENYSGDLVADPSYIWQCVTTGGIANCQAEYVDTPMCDYPVGTPCDSSNPGTGTNYDTTWNNSCQCIAFAGVCGDGIQESGEDCEHPTYCDEGTACVDNADCTGIGDELCQFRTFCSISNTICDLFNPCGMGEGDCEYDLEPGCAEDCTLVDVACADFTFNDVTADTPPFDTATLFEIEVDATASEKRWADIEINWGDSTIESIIMNAISFLSDPNATHTYDTASGNAYDVYITVSNPLSGAISDMCLIESYTINGVCGDTVVDFDEECDDGDMDETDICNNSCQFTTCGDLIRQNPNGESFAEECDGSADCTACACDLGFAPTGTGTCTADPIDGVCGSVDGTTIYDANNSGDSLTGGSENLCNVGDVTVFTFDTGSHTWTWQCEGMNGGANDSCTADELRCGDSLVNGGEECDGSGQAQCSVGETCTSCGCVADPIDGACGSVDATTIYDANNSGNSLSGGSANLCDTGSVSSFTFDTNTHSWSWDCTGANGGTDDSCSADELRCGDSLVNGGEECDGSGQAQCSVGETCTSCGCIVDAIDGACGSVDGTDIYDANNSGNSLSGGSANLCDTGSVSAFVFDTNTYVWSWDCTGENGGTDASCSANEHSCGDGTTDSGDGEACDDGNIDDGDGCDSTCQIEAPLEECGTDYPTTYYTTGVTQPDVAGQGALCTNTGDDSNIGEVDGVWTWDCVDETDCTATNEYCGDGIENGPEECDDGNGVDDDECNNSCEATSCGDGIINGTEECDEGLDNSPTGTCTTSCTITYCGDETVQSPNGEGTGGPSNNGVESCDQGPEGGTYGDPSAPDFCNENCESVEEPWCYVEVNPGCTAYTLYRGRFGVPPTNGVITVSTTPPFTSTFNPNTEGGYQSFDLNPTWQDETITYTATVGGDSVTCSVVLDCPITEPNPFDDPDGEDASGIASDTGVDLSIRSQIEACENEEGCIVKYKSDDETTADVAENNDTVDQTLDTISDDEVTNYGRYILTAADVSDAFARALYIPIGNGLTALELFKQLGFFDLLEFQDGEITKKDLIVAMTEILIRLGLLDEVEFELDNYKEAADVRDLRLVAVALRKVMQNSYLGFEDEEVRGRVAVGDRSTDIGALLCRRNGRTGCETEGSHEAANDIEPSKNLEQFYDVNPSSRVGQALAYVNAQRNIFHQKTFNEDGNVQLAVLYKTLALSLELEVDSSTVQGEDRGIGYLKALQNAGYFLDIDASEVALNHSVTRGELQMYLTDLLQTAQLLPTTSSKAGPSNKLSTLTTRGELVVALQQLIQLFEMYKQEVSNDIVSRQEQTPDRDGN